MRLNDLDLNLIKTFVLVAEEKGFSKAAKGLFVEQSAVSKAIKRLEDRIGTTLFLRTKRRVELTTKGATLLPIARQVLQSSEDLLKLAQDRENELSGVLRFGAASPISFLFLPEAISQISTDYPRVWPMMFTGIVDDLAQRVRRRELEFAFLDYEGARLKELEYKEIGICKYKIVASTQIKREAMNSFIGSREIHDQMAPKLPTFERLKRINRRIQIKYSANDMMAYKGLLLRGLGIGLLPELLIEKEVAQKKLKILCPEMKLSFPVLAAFHGSYRLSLEAERLIEICKTQINRSRR
jgi:DNA-binding transcriptional LysR family regulator